MNISIIGSCQTRDIFNSQFIENYKDYFQVYSYWTMTSMISVMGKPVPYNYDNLMNSGMNLHQLEHWLYEFEKPILRTLVSKKPDILLMDFYADARYGARMYAGEFLVNRLRKLKNKDIIDWKNLSIEYSYQKNTADFFIMWKNSVDRFMEFMKKRLPNTRIIINTVKGTKIITDGDGKQYIHPELKELDVDRINNLWTMMDNYIIQNYKVGAIRYKKQYTLDPDYLFGLGVALVHFHKEYYHDYFNKLVRIAEKIEKRRKKGVYQPAKVNLITESSFEFGTNNCYQMVGTFKKENHKGYYTLIPLDSRKKLGQYRPQIWSKAIEINGDGRTQYKLSFYIKIDDLSRVKEEMVVFGIRTFKQVKSIRLSESINAFSLNLEGHHIREKELYLYEYVFYPKGNYIKVAPFLFKYIGGIEYSRIRLQCMGSSNKLNRTVIDITED